MACYCSERSDRQLSRLFNCCWLLLLTCPTALAPPCSPGLVRGWDIAPHQSATCFGNCHTGGMLQPSPPPSQPAPPSKIKGRPQTPFLHKRRDGLDPLHDRPRLNKAAPAALPLPPHRRPPAARRRQRSGARKHPPPAARGSEPGAPGRRQRRRQDRPAEGSPLSSGLGRGGRSSRVPHAGVGVFVPGAPAAGRDHGPLQGRHSREQGKAWVAGAAGLC